MEFKSPPTLNTVFFRIGARIVFRRGMISVLFFRARAGSADRVMSASQKSPRRHVPIAADRYEPSGIAPVIRGALLTHTHAHARISIRVCFCDRDDYEKFSYTLPVVGGRLCRTRKRVFLYYARNMSS